ncbi:MAG TPA: heat-inducible transcriptional repressor HrcA [Longimicrobium sp.]|jgi:heat-inducible transcriptional repressor|uniref:heat-inducible transcriptional repressor HrcA n=1 Tax=Longimicrobium sp. TaxID=2029185 RepID=UPI002EDB61F7
MNTGEPLNEREHQILEAVIRTYVETAEPAGSRSVARRFDLGISAATVRNTMSDLEDKGYLYHPHTSAGRVPTDIAYRLYVDSLMQRPPLSAAERTSLRHELAQGGDGAAVERLLRRAAQVLGLLTQELGIAVAPRLEEATLERLDLIPLSEAKVLLVMSLRAAGVRTVFVDVPAVIPPSTLAAVAGVLNERLAGHSLREIRATLPDRLRDSVPSDRPGAELLNVFLQSADEWFAPAEPDDLHLGSASVLAEQPEFSSGEQLRSLISLTERRDLLKSAVVGRGSGEGLRVTIGVEHQDPALSGFTLVTSEYHANGLKGVIGVIGPTRMPYERVIALVETTSSMVSDLLM